MRSTANYRRGLTAISLVLAAGVMVLATVLQPDFTDPAGQLGAIADAGTPGVISALAFAYAQLPFIVAILGASQLISARAPIMSNLAATFGIIGGFGHAIHAGGTIVVLEMAADTANHEAYNQILVQLESGPAIPFMLMGLAGTVLGILFLAIGLGRAHVGPRWVPWALAAFLLVEFVGNSFSEWAAPAAVLIYTVTFVTLAVVAFRSPIDVWSGDADTAVQAAAVAAS